MSVFDDVPIEELQKAVQLRPDLVPLWQHLALRYAKAQRWDDYRAAILQLLYAERAQSWGANMPHYRAPQLVAEALPPGSYDLCDAGCGTGLVGALVKDRARRLDGVDISQPMLSRVPAGLYDQLHCGDLVAFLDARSANYDAVTSAATLIHFADLGPPLRAAATALRVGGLFVFTLFPGTEDIAPAPGLRGKYGCCLHSPAYVRRMAEERGFAVEMLEEAEHELNEGQPTIGLIARLRKRG